MCDICRGEGDVRYIDLYIYGSEGLRVCHDCEMEIVEFIRRLISRTLKEMIRRKLHDYSRE